MQVLPDAVIITLSPSQRNLLRDHTAFVEAIIVGKTWGRPRIPVSEISQVLKRLSDLKAAISNDPAYSAQRPAAVIDQLILKIEDAAATHRRTYPQS